jgi:hypothetical protein
MIAAAAALAAALSPSLAARRLLAADATVPRVEVRASGLPFAVDERGASAPEIVVDPGRLGGLPPGEAAAEYARALARAAIAAPVPLVEAEQAERQWTAQILAELSVEDAGLSKALRAAELRPDPAAPVLGRAAAFLVRFESDPGEAWWGVESGGGLPREAVRLTDLEDLLALRAADVRVLKEPPEGAYALLGGRRYPGGLVRAAYRLRAPGALERLREALGAFDTVGVAPLREALARRRRALLAR